MNCKNCNTQIEETAKYCSNCGANVVIERLTIKKTWSEVVSDFFGWDNKYLVTTKERVVSPEVILIFRL